MVEKIIKLPTGQWTFDDSQPLGRAGGFGEVFRGRGKPGNVAVKRLKLTADEAAHRELKIADDLSRRALKHVVPVLDAGQDADSDRYYVVMPVCDQNLQDVINSGAVGLELDHAIPIIQSIVSGLIEVQHIVHRDLKPSNILFHEGAWKIADFGISKFVQDATSIETLRYALTPQYAAPEQWMGERPTTATDVYALGCIIHALVTGSPPFPLNDIDELEKAHRFSVPPTLDRLSARAKSFVAQMLRKAPVARPSLQRCSVVFAAIARDSQDQLLSRALFDEAKAVVDAERAAAEAKAQLAAAAERRLNDLFDASVADFSRLITLIASELGASPRKRTESHVWRRMRIPFCEAALEFDEEPSKTYYGAGESIPPHSLEIICYNDLLLRSKNHPYTWSTSLVYANFGAGDGFRWYEIGFREVVPPPSRVSWARWKVAVKKIRARFGREDEEEVDEIRAAQPAPFSVHAGRRGMRTDKKRIEYTRVAYGPLPIDAEDEHAFIERWLNLIGTAASGRLREPDAWPAPELGFGSSPLADEIERTLGE